MTITISKARSITSVIPAVTTLEGAGFVVHRPFPTRSLTQIDPFMLLDEMGPMDLPPGEALGAPDHPHRGFETVSYILEGTLAHKDSQGNSGRLASGDVQWMTAGSGVVHSEMPDEDFVRTGGRMHGFQLWVNLPRRDKMMRPRYQEITAGRIPVAHSQDGNVSVRVIAGEALGSQAVIDTRTPIMYLHFTLEPGASIVQPVGSDYNVFAYVIDGPGLFGDTARRVRERHIIVFGRDGEGVRLAATAEAPLNVLLIGGVPLNEPVARYGPFVMNTEQEIEQAILDYQAGRMGKIDF